MRRHVTLSAPAKRRIAASRVEPTRLLESFTLADALEEGVRLAALPYLEAVVEALEDGEIDRAEHAALTEIAELHQLSVADRASCSGSRGW